MRLSPSTGFTRFSERKERKSGVEKKTSRELPRNGKPLFTFSKGMRRAVHNLKAIAFAVCLIAELLYARPCGADSEGGQVRLFSALWAGQVRVCLLDCLVALRSRAALFLRCPSYPVEPPRTPVTKPLH